MAILFTLKIPDEWKMRERERERDECLQIKEDSLYETPLQIETWQKNKMAGKKKNDARNGKGKWNRKHFNIFEELGSLWYKHSVYACICNMVVRVSIWVNISLGVACMHVCMCVYCGGGGKYDTIFKWILVLGVQCGKSSFFPGSQGLIYSKKQVESWAEVIWESGSQGLVVDCENNCLVVEWGTVGVFYTPSPQDGCTYRYIYIYIYIYDYLL